MDAYITHKCGHTKVVPVKGIKEAKQYKRWLASQPCVQCRGK
jgi:hypothetical protein